jgi:elongation factor 1 alpha-like protein
MAVILISTGTKTKKSAPHHTSGDKAANDVTNSVAALGLSVEEVPKVKSKNLDVLKEFEQSNMKRMANFVVIGKNHSNN